MNKVRISLAGFVCIVFCAFTGSVRVIAQPEARYEIASTRNVMVAMRDGTRLATNIHRPARNGTPVDEKFPVLLERTPYNKDTGGSTLMGGTTAPSSPTATVNYFVPRGYVVVYQDVRGRYASEGHWTPIRDDPNDGFDTAKWIA